MSFASNVEMGRSIAEKVKKGNEAGEKIGRFATDEDPDDTPSIGELKPGDSGSHWITIHPNGSDEKGRHILVNRHGRIIGGMGSGHIGDYLGALHGSPGRANSRTSAWGAFGPSHHVEEEYGGAISHQRVKHYGGEAQVNGPLQGALIVHASKSATLPRKEKDLARTEKREARKPRPFTGANPLTVAALRQKGQRALGKWQTSHESEPSGEHLESHMKEQQFRHSQAHDARFTPMKGQWR
jgi:hypothetical protein